MVKPALTVREKELLDCLRQGLKRDAIAHTLGIARESASVFKSRLLRKFGATTQEELLKILELSDKPFSVPRKTEVAGYSLVSIKDRKPPRKGPQFVIEEDGLQSLYYYSRGKFYLSKSSLLETTHLVVFWLEKVGPSLLVSINDLERMWEDAKKTGRRQALKNEKGITLYQYFARKGMPIYSQAPRQKRLTGHAAETPS